MAGFLPKSLPLRLVQFSASRPRRVLAAYFLLIVIAALFANRIRIDSDFLALVPDNNEVVREFKTTVTRFGSIDMLLIALEIDPEKDPEEAIVYADIFAEELRLSENITWVEYRLQDFTAAAETLLDRVTLFMGPEELEDFLKRFEDEGMNQAVNTLADKVRNPLDVAFRDLLVRDPLGVAPLLTRKLDLEGMGAQFNSDSGYLISPNGDLLLMLVKPEKPAANLPFSRALLAELDVIRDTTTQLWHEEDFEGTPPNVRLRHHRRRGRSHHSGHGLWRRRRHDRSRSPVRLRIRTRHRFRHLRIASHLWPYHHLCLCRLRHRTPQLRHISLCSPAHWARR